MATTPCPDAAELLAFHRGELTEDDLDRIADHLEDCPDCAARLETLEREVPDLTDLRRAATAGLDDPPTTFNDAQGGPDDGPEFDIPGYERLGVLGSGGMGVVHKARHLALGRTVALKRLRAGSAGDLRRFRREAEAVAALQHPNVVQIYEVGEHRGRPYLALEYVPGGSLDALARGRPQGERESAALVAALAGAVEHAHRRGVVHRDLKPANVLLQPRGEGPGEGLGSYTPKVGDFGVAKWLDGEGAGAGTTRAGAVVGTPSYMAPEQARGEAVGPASDVYALGAILYELLTGRPPFRGAGAAETLHQVVYGEPVPPSRLRPGLGRDLETVCLRCLHKEPGRRYGSAALLAEDLGRYLEGRPVSARRASWAETGWRWSRRHPGAAAGLGVAQASLVLLAGGAWWYNARLRDALDDTRRAQQAAARNEQRARTNLRQAEANERQAEQNARLALEAHQQLVGRVKDLLKDRPDSRPLREALLTTAIDGLRRVITDEGDGDWAPRLSRALAYNLLGDVHRQLGRVPEALEAFSRARELAAGLLAEGRDPEESRALVVEALVKIGSIQLRKGEADAARATLREAITLGEAWYASEPSSRPALLGLVDGYAGLAHAAHWVYDLDGSEAAAARLRELVETWRAREPSSAQARAALADTYERVAAIASTRGDENAAGDAYGKMLEQARAALELEPASLQFRHAVAMSAAQLGTHALGRGDLDGARRLLDESAAHLRALLDADPESISVQLFLVDLRRARADVELEALRPADALPHLREARATIDRLRAAGKLADRPQYGLEASDRIDASIAFCELLPKAVADASLVWAQPPEMAGNLAVARVRALLAQGRADEARATAESLVDRPLGDDHQALHLARACARAAGVYKATTPADPGLVARLVAHGLEALLHCVETRETPLEPDMVKGDGTLAALRDEPGFARALERLAARRAAK